MILQPLRLGSVSIAVRIALDSYVCMVDHPLLCLAYPGETFLFSFLHYP